MAIMFLLFACADAFAALRCRQAIVAVDRRAASKAHMAVLVTALLSSLFCVTNIGVAVYYAITLSEGDEWVAYLFGIAFYVVICATCVVYMRTVSQFRAQISATTKPVDGLDASVRV